MERRDREVAGEHGYLMRGGMVQLQGSRKEGRNAERTGGEQTQAGTFNRSPNQLPTENKEQESEV